MKTKVTKWSLALLVLGTIGTKQGHAQSIPKGTPLFTTPSAIYDKSGQIGIGTTSPTARLQVGIFGPVANPANIFLGEYSKSKSSALVVGNWASSGGFWGIGPKSISDDRTLRIGAVSTADGIWDATHELTLALNGKLQVGVTGLAPNADNPANIFIGEYSHSQPSALLVGGWASSSVFWGIGPKSINDDHTLRIGAVSTADGTWNGTWDLTLDIKGNGHYTNNLLVDGNFGVGTNAPLTKLQLGNYAAAASANPASIFLAEKPSAGSALVVGNWASSSVFWGIGPLSGSDDHTLRIGAASNPNGAWSATPNFALNIDGKVGIGTSAPQAQLHVIGSAKIERADGSSQVNALTIGMTSNAFADPSLAAGTINFIASDPNKTSDMAFSANGESHQLVIKNNGNVGIGAYAPLAKLQIGSSSIVANHPANIFFGERATSSSGPGSALVAGNWASSSCYWGIGPKTTDDDRTLNIGAVSAADGSWDATHDLTLAVSGQIQVGTPGLALNADNPANIFFGGYSQNRGSAVLVSNWASSGKYWGIGPLSGSAGDDHFVRIGTVSDAYGNWDATQNVNLNITGALGIGTVAVGNCKLAVEGTIGAREIKVTAANPFPDYVFGKDYNLPSLNEVENYININHHLPEIPSACEVEENKGIDLGAMNTHLLKKVEELTLYIIEQNKRIEVLEAAHKN